MLWTNHKGPRYRVVRVPRPPDAGGASQPDGVHSPRMRSTIAAIVLLLAGCASSKGADGKPADWDAPLSADLVPFDAPPATFVDVKDPEPRTMRAEPAADGSSVRFVLEVGESARELRVSRRDGSLFFSTPPDPEVELIRGGARPGDVWVSADQRITFDGWERVTLPDKTYEAARITVRRGPLAFQLTETWWFAKGVGLVRQRTDRGSMFVEERYRSSK